MQNWEYSRNGTYNSFYKPICFLQMGLLFIWPRLYPSSFTCSKLSLHLCTTFPAMKDYSTRDLITEAVNKLFNYTDARQWDKLLNDVFTNDVLFDMSSLGGPKAIMTAKDICDMWQKGFEGIDAINHLAGNYLVDIKQDSADVFAYATATHYKASATKGKTREFVGTYDIHLTKTQNGWRIDQFRYNLKYATGNTDLT